MSGPVQARRGRSLYSKVAVSVFAFGAIGAVAGCSMFHSNIKGGFLCSAPNGSCAPTSIIDDGAIRSIRQNEKTDKGGDLVLPAVSPSPAAPDEIIYPSERPGKDGKVVASLSGHSLKVVYPAHVGADGKLVPKRIAYALVDLPEWQEVVTADGRVNDPVSHGLLGAAQSAPDAFAMVSASAVTGPVQTSPSPAAPIRPVEGQAAKPSTAQIEAIKAQADQILRAGKIKTAGSFPPEGN